MFIFPSILHQALEPSIAHQRLEPFKGHQALESLYRNPSLGLTTMIRACKGAGQERSPRVTLHALGRLKIWESGRIEPTHSQMNSHFGNGSWSPNGVPKFQRTIANIKTHWI
jgi:hypothetical protein